MKQNNGKTVIGFTGGVGSGKSTVLGAIASRYDVHVIKADEVGRRLMEPGRKIYKALVKAYGTGILLENGAIDRKKVADIVFNDRKELERINRIEHPMIRQSIRQSIRQTRKSFVFLEAALIQEGGLTELSDEIMAVTAKDSVRMKRLSENRGYTEEKSKAIIAKQLSNADFKALAHVCFDNSGDLNDTLKQVFAYLDERRVPIKGER